MLSEAQAAPQFYGMNGGNRDSPREMGEGCLNLVPMMEQVFN